MCFQTALNMVIKSMSVDLKSLGILVVAVQPGWVVTKMGGPNALISTAESVTGLLKVMAGLSEADAGCMMGKFCPGHEENQQHA